MRPAGYTGEVVVRSAKPRYIAVEGPIGVGKTASPRSSAQELSARVILDERPQENPFLGAFYRDRRRHAMSVQLFFLLQRYAQQGELAQGDLFSRGGVVTDYIFAEGSAVRDAEPDRRRAGALRPHLPDAEGAHGHGPT